MPPLWYALPFIAAGIGWLTNFVAVRMIFRPRQRVSILGLGLQGLLPKRKKEFAASIGATVSEHLVRPEDVAKALSSPTAHAKIQSIIQGRVDEFFDRKLAQKVPMLAGFLKGPIAESIKQTLLDEMTTGLETNADRLVEILEESLDLHALVEQKIESFDFDQLEAMVLRVAKKELRAIEWLGALLGFVVGTIQLALMAL